MYVPVVAAAVVADMTVLAAGLVVVLVAGPVVGEQQFDESDKKKSQNISECKTNGYGCVYRAHIL